MKRKRDNGDDADGYDYDDMKSNNRNERKLVFNKVLDSESELNQSAQVKQQTLSITFILL